MEEQKRKKKCPEPGKSTPAWMTTFGDMNSLLLTFFVAILTYIEIEGRELRLILSAFTGQFGMLEGGTTLTVGTIADMAYNIESLPARVKGEKLAEAVKEMQNILKPELKAQKVSIVEAKKGIKITLSSDILFPPGSAAISFEEGRQTLLKISQMIKDLVKMGGFKIEVIGHTDNSPIPDDSKIALIYPSNWELSTARASAVVEYFEDFGIDSSLLYAEGKGEYEPVFPNDTIEGRAYNRRIEIFISMEEIK